MSEQRKINVDTLAKWEPALIRVLEDAVQPGWYGVVRIEVQNGQVQRLLIERSIKDPRELARIPEESKDPRERARLPEEGRG